VNVTLHHVRKLTGIPQNDGFWSSETQDSIVLEKITEFILIILVRNLLQCTYTMVHKKGATFIFLITRANIDGFS